VKQEWSITETHSSAASVNHLPTNLIWQVMEALTPTYTSQTYHSKDNNYKEASKVLICNSSYDT